MQNQNLKEITISLEKFIYFPGEIIRGTVNFRLGKRLPLNELIVSMIGDAKVHWSSWGSLKRVRRKVEKKYTAVENYLNIVKKIVVKPGNQDLFIEAGSHLYPFDFTLPKSLPSSFEHPSGRVRYRFLVEVVSPLRPKEYYEKSFTIVDSSDSNLFINRFSQPGSMKVTKKFSFLTSSHNDVFITLNTLSCAFVPGQAIQFSIVIQNESKRDIKNVSIQLLQHVQIKSRSNYRVVTSYKFPKIITRKSTELIRNGQLIIPAVCPSFNGLLISVSYLIYVNFKATKKRVKIKQDTLTMPILIGNRPFGYAFSQPIGYSPDIFGANFQRKDIKFTPNSRPENFEYDYRPYYAIFN